MIHPFWKQLVWEGIATLEPEDDGEDDEDDMWAKMIAEYEAGTMPKHVQRQVIQGYAKSKDIGTLEEPICAKPKGRPRKNSKVQPRGLTRLEHLEKQQQLQPPKRTKNVKGARTMPGQAFYSIPQVDEPEQYEEPEEYDYANEDGVPVIPQASAAWSTPPCAPTLTSHFGGLDLRGRVPSYMIPYIVQAHDVPSDGHCGYSSLASLVGWSAEDGWYRMRQELVQELLIHRNLYEGMQLQPSLMLSTWL